MSNNLEKLLNNNKAWVASKLSQDEKYFDKLSSQHAPKYLWIGCSDARVPANTIIGLEAGEVFVHRNVGNVVAHSDNNIRAVIGYAVEALGVQNIIVTGHYGCGAVKASLGAKSNSSVEHWIYNIRDVIRENNSLMNEASGLDRENLLCELNVKTQVRHVAETQTLVSAWKDGKSVSIHGWIYDIKDGLLKDLNCSISSLEESKALETSPVVNNL